MTHIRHLVETDTADAREAFDRFVASLRTNLNDGVTPDDAIEMLAQHLVTRPVFDALFANYPFSQQNPVSRSLDAILHVLDQQALDEEVAPLEPFYESVRRRASSIDNAEARQRIVVELYDGFFRTAFPRTAARLGIVYTPVELVDFILQSADWALHQTFGLHLTSPDVHVLDPFTGSGTFLVRLLQSDLLDPADLARKYHSELHANEILLLPYYIAAVNIEDAYHQRAQQAYQPFPGIVLTDTFQLGEQAGAFEALFLENNTRARRQTRQPIQVIVGNPPWSVGQDSANDQNQNQAYPQLDERIRTT